MRRIATYLILSLFLSLGTGYAYADRTHDKSGHRHEQKYKGEKKHDKGKDKKSHGKSDKKGHPGNHGMSAPRPGNSSHKPGPGPKPGVGAPKPGAPKPGWSSAPRPGVGAPKSVGHPHGKPQYYNGPKPPRLDHMVRHASRGGQIMNVWRVDYNTYVVQYRKGNKYYTQYVYPYADRYGSPSLINVNWNPPTPWSLLPPIQLNINL